MEEFENSYDKDKLKVPIGITCQEYDALALISHKRAAKSNEIGVFKKIITVDIKCRIGTVIFDTNEYVMLDVSMEKPEKLNPVFVAGGVVTANNAASINDGSLAGILINWIKLAAPGIQSLMRPVTVYGKNVDPTFMGTGPVRSIPKCLKQADIRFEDIDY